MKAIVTGIQPQYDESGKPQLLLTLKLSRNTFMAAVAELKGILAKGKELALEIKQYRKKRSLDANGYMWVLCQKIAEKIAPPGALITKEDVYRKAIREVGQFTIVPIRNDAVEQWIYNWGAGRIGWVCESLGDSKLEGYTNIMSYYGSSVYDTKSMSILVDYIVSEAKEQGIETMTPTELEGLKQEWKKG